VAAGEGAPIAELWSGETGPPDGTPVVVGDDTLGASRVAPGADVVGATPSVTLGTAGGGVAGSWSLICGMDFGEAAGGVIS
jgi:hypothetical protein